MNSQSTPLQILAQELGVTNAESLSAKQLHDVLPRFCKTMRQKEVVEYLIAAADGRLGEQGAGGSLKFVLWWSRDHLGDLWPVAGRAVLATALKGHWPLRNALPNLRQVAIVENYLDELARGVDARGLCELLEIRRIGRWKIAVNTTSLNLLKIAARHTDADFYVAASEQGGVVKAIQERGGQDAVALLDNLFPKLGSSWHRPYPDLVLTKETTTLDTILGCFL